MEEYIGRKKVIVEQRKYNKLDGTVSKYPSTGILNIPEENPGTCFWILKTEDGFIMDKMDNGGKKRCVRKSSIQNVITVGRIEDKSTVYRCFKTENGYLFKKLPEMEGIGSGKNIIYLHKDNRERLYFCLSLNFIKYLKVKCGEYLKITTKIQEDMLITIEKATEPEEKKNEIFKKVSYAKYDGKNKSLTICKRAEKFLKDCEMFVVLQSKGKLKLLPLKI